MTLQKNKPFRSASYRQYIANLPCCISGYHYAGNDPHHLKGRGFGSSVKCSDLFCIPLRHDLHQELHTIGWQSFEDKWHMNQLEQALYTIEQAFNDGVLKYEP